VWSAPLQILIGTVLLWLTIGASVLAGVAVMVVMIPLNKRLAKVLSALQKETLKQTDERIKSTGEMLNCIMMIKYFAWETAFSEKICKIRNAELKMLKRGLILRTLTVFLVLRLKMQTLRRMKDFINFVVVVVFFCDCSGLERRSLSHRLHF
jgi:helix-turn-helix protein